MKIRLSVFLITIVSQSSTDKFIGKCSIELMIKGHHKTSFKFQTKNSEDLTNALSDLWTRFSPKVFLNQSLERPRPRCLDHDRIFPDHNKKFESDTVKFLYLKMT